MHVHVHCKYTNVPVHVCTDTSFMIILFRQISVCSTKSLSKLLTTCLAVTHVEYCNGIYSNTGVNCFRIIENSQQILDLFILIFPLLCMSIVLIFQIYILAFHMPL